MTASVWNPAGSTANVANADNNYKHQTFIVDAPTALTGIFTLTTFAYQPGTESLLIEINGVAQLITQDYTETSNNVVTIPNVKLNDQVVIRGLVGSEASQSAAASAAQAAAAAASIIGLNPPNLPVAVNIGGTGANNKTNAFNNLAPDPQVGGIPISVDGIGYTTIPSITNRVTNPVTSVTLTAATIGYHNCTMNSLGKSITFPDATTLTTGSPRAIIDNTKGGYPVGLRDNTGVLFGAVAPGGEALISLKDNSTPAGVWSAIGNNIEPGFISVDSTFSSTYSATTVIQQVALDNNTSIHFATLASGGFAAFILDNLGKVVTVPTTVTVTANQVPRCIFKINATQVILFYGQTATSAFAVVLTVSGVSPSLALSVGTPLAITNVIALDTENSISTPKVIQLTPTLYASSYKTGTNTTVQAYQIAGTTVSQGAAVNVITANSVSSDSLTFYSLTANTALLLYLQGPAPNTINGVIISFVGTVITINIPTGGSTLGNSTLPSASVLLSPTKAIIADDNGVTNGTEYYVTSIIIAGVTVTFGVRLLVETGITPTTGLASYSILNSTRYNPPLWAIGANTAGLWYTDGSISRTVILSESAGVITPGSISYKNISQNVLGADNAGVILSQGTAEFITLKQEITSGGSPRLRLQANKITGSVITTGACSTSHVDSVVSPVSVSTLSFARLTSGDYTFIVGSNTFMTSIPIYRSNGDYINSRGVITCPMQVTTNTVQGGRQTIFSNRLVLVASALLQGQVGSISNAQLRVINVEIAS